MASSIQAKFEVSRTLNASVNEGRAREVFLNGFLKRVLPPSLSTGHGEIWNSAGQKTGQLDIVVLRQDAPRLTFETESEVDAYLAEGVFAVVEVKSDLSTARLQQAIETLRKVRDVSTSVPIAASVGPYVDRPLRVVFAYTGVTYSTMLAELTKPDNLDVADFVCVLEHGGWFRTEIASKVGLTAGPGVPAPYIGLWKSGPALAMLYYFLNQFAGSFVARSIPLVPYFTPIEGWGD